MRSRTVDIAITGFAGIAVGLGLLYTAVKVGALSLTSGQKTFAYSAYSRSGDSPILISGGSMNVFSQNNWSTITNGVSTQIGDGSATYNNIILDGVAPMDPKTLTPSSWYGVGVPWSIYLHGRYPNGAVLKPILVGVPNPDGLKLCQRTTTGNADCDVASALPVTFDASHPSLIPADGNGGFYKPDNYGVLLSDLITKLYLRRYHYIGNDATCLEPNGGLCEHIGQIDVTFQTGVGTSTTSSFRCLNGTCSIQIGGY